MTKVTALEELTSGSLAIDDVIMISDVSASSSKKITVDNLLTSGWFQADSMVYGSSDDPTYTMTCTGDKTSKYQAGQKIKLTQSTGGTKYFIITKVEYSSSTTLTLYGGTDYNLENEAISSPYYSIAKAPFGFPLSPTKWTEAYIGEGAAQDDPVVSTWYNVGGSLSIPIGVWYVEHIYSAYENITASTGLDIFTTLSTANNTDGGSPWTIETWFQDSHANSALQIISPSIRTGVISLSTKATYYGNAKYEWTTTVARIRMSSNIIRAVSAYL